MQTDTRHLFCRLALIFVFFSYTASEASVSLNFDQLETTLAGSGIPKATLGGIRLVVVMAPSNTANLRARLTALKMTSPLEVTVFEERGDLQLLYKREGGDINIAPMGSFSEEQELIFRGLETGRIQQMVRYIAQPRSFIDLQLKLWALNSISTRLKAERPDRSQTYSVVVEIENESALYKTMKAVRGAKLKVSRFIIPSNPALACGLSFSSLNE